MNIRNIRYLVCGGGGMAGLALTGALDQLSQEPEFSFEKIIGTGGSSIGAFTGFGVSLNFSPAEIYAKWNSIDFKKLEDGGAIHHQFFRLFRNSGMHKGEALTQVIYSMLAEKIPNKPPEKITFADLKELGFKDLYVVVSKLYKEDGLPNTKYKIFSHKTTPHTSVALALRASMAAPPFFPPIRLKKIAPGCYVEHLLGHLYGDGGISNNFPLEIFDKPEFMQDAQTTENINYQTLGLILRHTAHLHGTNHKASKTPINNYQPFEVMEAMFNGFSFQSEKKQLADKHNAVRSIQIDRGGVKLNDFGLDANKKNALFAAGKQAVKNYFAALRQENPEAQSEYSTNAIVSSLWQTVAQNTNTPETTNSHIANVNTTEGYSDDYVRYCWVPNI